MTHSLATAAETSPGGRADVGRRGWRSEMSGVETRRMGLRSMALYGRPGQPCHGREPVYDTGVLDVRPEPRRGAARRVAAKTR